MAHLRREDIQATLNTRWEHREQSDYGTTKSRLSRC
jgi:hypothetical protein